MAYGRNNTRVQKDFSGKQEYKKASIMWDNRIKAYRVKFDWVGQDFVDLLKLAIPSSDRSMKKLGPNDYEWYILDGHMDVFKMLFDAKFGTVTYLSRTEVEEQWKQHSMQPRQVNTEDRLKEFTSYLHMAGIQYDPSVNDPQLVQRLYRKAAMFYHPDRNPANAEAMSKLNAAFQDLKEYFGLSK